MKLTLKGALVFTFLTVAGGFSFHFWNENKKLREEIQKRDTVISISKIIVENKMREIQKSDQAITDLKTKLYYLQTPTAIVQEEETIPEEIAPGGP